MKRWLSGYVYLAEDLSAQDSAIAAVVRPFFRRCGALCRRPDSFFIRYWEQGPHIRIRVKLPATALDEAKIILEALVRQDAVAEFLGQPSSRPSEFAASGHPSLVWREYEPEILRYGGTEGIAVAERFFAASSKLVLTLIDALAAQTLDRRGVGLVSLLALLSSFAQDRADAPSLVRRYAEQFHPVEQRISSSMNPQPSADAALQRQEELLATRIRHWWRLCATPTCLPVPFRRYALAADRARDALVRGIAIGSLVDRAGRTVGSLDEAVTQLCPSYMHMTSNRLGLSNREESYLAGLVSRALQ